MNDSTLYLSIRKTQPKELLPSCLPEEGRHLWRSRVGRQGEKAGDSSFHRLSAEIWIHLTEGGRGDAFFCLHMMKIKSDQDRFLLSSGH